ncbi:MAG: hypothetical protein E7012_04400 [Alphaproteobacteria bacterium]|nr:hypothetical protein [Alphaproteobacteria bacterium]
MTEKAELVFEGLLNKLYTIPFQETSKIKDIEAKIFTELQKYPANIYGLITLMFLQIMQANRVGAKDTAFRIWDIGGDLSPYFELVYIENLINIGLLDMAKILLTTKFENIRENIDDFYSVMVKYAIVIGDLSLLSKIKQYDEYASENETLYEFAEMYQESGYSGQFKNIQKMIIEQQGNNICAYEYNLYDDRGFPELEIEIYNNTDSNQIVKEQEQIDKKIDAYWFSCGKERLYNHSVTFKNIREHERWIEVEADAMEE